MLLYERPIIKGKFTRTNHYAKHVGDCEDIGIYADLEEDTQVLVGVGMRADLQPITTLKIGVRPLDAQTGQLGELEYFYNSRDCGNSTLVEVGKEEARGQENILLAGIGCQSYFAITTLVFWYKTIDHKGCLDNLQEISTGNLPDIRPLDVQIIVPDPYVIVSIGVSFGKAGILGLEGLFSYLAKNR